MTQNIQIRADILFQFNHSELGGSNYRFFHLNEFITRVEKIIIGEDNEVRYGFMVDFENDGNSYQKSYMIEIPVVATDAVKRKEKQEALIKQYVNEMRSRFQTYYAKITSVGTIDEFDQIERQLNSADGLWNILRGFRNNKLISFSDWLFKNKFSTKEQASNFLTKARMTFEAGQEYLISTDWPLPYIAYKDDYKVSHFETDSKSDHLFYPFHNFHWQKIDLCTSIIIEHNLDYASTYKEGYTLKPNNYSLFAYYTFLIDNVIKLQQQNYKNISAYYLYIQNLNAIQQKLQKYGPTAKMTEETFAELDLAGRQSWDGSTVDGCFGGSNTEDFALGMNDIDVLISALNAIVFQESSTGRNANNAVSIISLTYSLKESFLDNKIVKNNFDELWAFNNDDFGFNIIFRKIMSLLSQVGCAEDVYKEHLKKGLFEHSLLDESLAENGIPEFNRAEWGNVFYRTNAITFEIWMNFYPIREQFLKEYKLHDFKLNGMPATPHSGHIATWISHNVIFPDAIAGSSSASMYYKQWKLKDAQVRKLANYLLGGNVDGKLKVIEESLSLEIQRLFGTVSFKEIPFDKVDELHNILLAFKRELIISHIPTVNTTVHGHVANIGASALNFYMVMLAYDNAYSSNASTINKLRAHSLAVGLFSDAANTVAKFRGVQSTLLRTVAQKAGGRVALGLGAAELIGGGVGGILGTIWFTYDSFGAWNKGFQKDSMLDAIAAAGCVVSAAGLIADGTVVGLPVGVVLNVVGITMVLISQTLKYSRVLNSNTEDYCKHLFGELMKEGGMERLKVS